ncbi:Hsp70 family protein [Mycobacterium sp. pR1184]|uniref:Hsp70 family protein n=1 Tax=Mycobacterium sp. pR1184 TaxID=3238981 RepID=UPI00351AE434
MWSLAVDFGTTATAAAVGIPATQPAALVLANGAMTMPSSVFAERGGALLAGEDADNFAADDWQAYEPTPKRRVDSDRIRLGHNEYSPAQLIGAVIGPIIAEAVRQRNDEPPARLVLTHPVRWRKTHRDLLAEAVRTGFAGSGGIELPTPEFVSEPVAAAHWLARRNPPRPGDFVAVYDLGGGTFDTTVLRAQPDGRFDEVVARGISPLGGFDFDQALFTHLGERYIHPADPGLWTGLADPATEDPTVLRQRRQLRDRARLLKHRLTTAKEFALSLPGVGEPVTVTRFDYESLIRAHVVATTTELSETISDAGLDIDDISVIYRVGGAAITPLVRAELDDLLRPRDGRAWSPSVQTDEEHWKLVVALGAVTMPAERTQHQRPRRRPVTTTETPPASAAASDPTAAVRSLERQVAGTDPELASIAAVQLARIPLLDRLTARHDGALSAATVGDYGLACTELEAVVRERTATLGAQHSDTLQSRRLLAQFRMLSGETNRAAIEFAEMSKTYRALNDPWALVCDYYHSQCANDIAVDTGYLSRLHEAAATLCAQHVQQFGPDSDETVSARHALVQLYELDGRRRDAIDEYRHLVEAMSKLRGAEHSDTLQLRLRLGVLLRSINDMDAGLSELQAVVAALAESRGADDADTLVARVQSADRSGLAHGAPASAADWTSILHDANARLGPDHPVTLYAAHAHAIWLADDKRYAEALTELEAVTAARTRVLGPRNLCALQSRWQLAVVAGHAGYPARAAVELKRVSSYAKAFPAVALSCEGRINIAGLTADLKAWWARCSALARRRYAVANGTSEERAAATRQAWLRF